MKEFFLYGRKEFRFSKSTVCIHNGNTVILVYSLYNDTLETSLICILLLANRDVHFDKRMICFLIDLSLKSTSESKQQRKAYHLKDTSLLCDF